jgi:hypothetical protein
MAGYPFVLDVAGKIFGQIYGVFDQGLDPDISGVSVSQQNV